MRRMPAQLGKLHSRSNAERPRGKSVSSPQGPQSAQLEAMLEAGSHTATLAQLAARLSSSPRMAAQRALATSIRNSPHAAAQRRRMETHSEYRPLASPGVVQAQSVVQRVAGRSGLQSIKDAIHEGNGQAKEIANDLYKVDAEHDGRFDTPTADTKNKIKISAQSLGYDDEHADRLASKKPYKRDEILLNTRRLNSGTAGSSYELESFRDYTCPNPYSSNRHNLHFQNEYGSDGTVRFSMNFRNPAMAEFHANEVFNAQREFIRTQIAPSTQLPDVTRMVRSNVVSTSGRNWMGSSFHAGALGPNQLASFLTTTVNGRSSQRIAASMGKTIVSGSVSGSSDNWSVTLILQAGSTREEATTAGRSDSHDAQHRGSNATAATALANTASGSGTQNAQETDVDKAARLFAEITHRFSASRDANIGNYQPYIDRMAQHLQKMREVPADASLRIPYFMQAFETVNGALNRSSM